MKRLALLGMLLLVAGCQQHSTSSSYLEAAQLLEVESAELQRVANWHDYVRTAFLPDGFYPFEGDNLRGIIPKTKEEAAEIVQKAAENLARQRQRVERARKARDAADR